ncbi:MAG: eukaryotic-like serine/threonine-protein kinase [Mycobacterium sp.]|nr:eukaryotic-like serine/threonine-protein kinase [Mycobacterium sp.]
MIGVGTVLAGYRIERIIGAGGMGTVYVAQNPELPRRDALKVLSAELSRNDEYRARFIREADVASRLQHPNVVSIYSRGETDDGHLWIAMQFIDGTDADDALRTGSMTPTRAVHIVGEIARALDYAHRHNIVHRDVKPANFLLSHEGGGPEQVLLGDFGIARAIDDVGLTLTGSVIATMAYAAPEVLAGHRFDGRADVYSLGCSLFRLLTGKTPFAGASANGPAAVMMAHLHQPPPRVTDRLPRLPSALDSVIAIALAKEPAERFESTVEFASAAAAALRNQPASGMALRAVPVGEVSSYPNPRDSGWWRPAAGPRTLLAAPGGLAVGSPPHPQTGPSRRRRRLPWAIGALAAIVLLAAGTVTTLELTRHTGQQNSVTNTASSATTAATTSPTPAPRVLVSALPALLVPIDQLKQLMGDEQLQVAETAQAMFDISPYVGDVGCVGAYGPTQTTVYATSGFMGLQRQAIKDPSDPKQLNNVGQAVVAFLTAEQAQAAVAGQVGQWQLCANRTTSLNLPGRTPAHVTFGAPSTVADGVHEISLQVESNPSQQHCQRALTARNNIVVDISSCSMTLPDPAVRLADVIASKISQG